jgi:hypothetical protein
MHGTFPKRAPEQRPRQQAADLWTCLAFASIPLGLAIVAAVLRFGSDATLANVVDVLVAASAAAPM